MIRLSVMPEEPVCKLAPLIDRFRKIGELVTSRGVDFPHDTAGTAVGQDAVYLPVYLLQIFSASTYSRAFGISSAHQERPLTPEHSSHSVACITFVPKSGGLRIKDAILNVVGRGSSHREPGKTTEGEDLAPHQVEDVFPHHVLCRRAISFPAGRSSRSKFSWFPSTNKVVKGFFSQSSQCWSFASAVPQPSVNHHR